MKMPKKLREEFIKLVESGDFGNYLVPKSELVESGPSPVEEPSAEKTYSNRRQFMAHSVLATSGLALAVSFGTTRVFAKAPGRSEDKEFSPNAFLKIPAEGAIKIIAMHDEMGQGTHTGLAIAICEELEIAPSQVVVEHAPADVRYNHNAFGVQMTGGSTSMISAFDAMRKAGATAREMLIAAAAKRWKVEPTSCSAKNGRVVHKISGKKLTYGELASEAATMPVPETVTLKDPKNFSLVGKPTRRVDSASKTRGTALFSYDQTVDGMLIGMVERCPYFGGTLTRFDASQSEQVEGVKAVFQVPSGIAVVAKDYWSAIKARKALQCEWAPGRSSMVDTDELRVQYHELAKQKGRVAESIGNCEEALANNDTLEAVYEVPFQAHAPMEPLSCLVTLADDGGANLITGSQFLGVDRTQAAARLDVDPSKVTIENSYLGGGFGRRANPKSDFVVEAVDVALGAKKMGILAPIKTCWTREDDIRGGWYRPMYINGMSAAFQDNKIVGWRHRVVGQSPIIGTAFEPVIVVDGLDTWAVEGATKLAYEIPHRQVEMQTIRLPVPVQWWRAVGHSNSGFAKESFFDECAVKLKRDPLELRQELLKDHPRMLRVLNLAAEKFGWPDRLPEGRGKGISVHESFQSYTAHAVEASVEDGRPVVHRIVVAVDCGPTINPDQVVAQMESAANFALSATLQGQITFKEGKVVQSNFDDFQVVRMNEAPQIEVHIVSSDAPMGGIGETGVAGIPSAVCSAIFDACGQRIRRLPIGDQLKS